LLSKLLFTAFVLVNCANNWEQEVLSGLKHVVEEVQGTYGIFDFVCKIQGQDMTVIEKTLSDIKKIQHISHTTTIHTIPEQNKD